MKLGFIGLGNIGRPLAINLAKAGHQLTVHDLERARAEGLFLLGARWAGSPQETAAASDVLFTSLPGPKQVEQAITGRNGALNGLSAGSLWVDLSTSDVTLTRRLASLLADRGIESLDAPVTGGVANARAGKISIFVGGSLEAYKRVLPLLSAMAERVFHFGPIGNATIVKLITNFMSMIHVAALGEGLVLGKALGIDEIQIWEAIKSSYADSFVARVDGPNIFSGDYGQSFGIGLACKDLALSLDIASQAGIELKTTKVTQELYEAARVQYGDASGCLGVVRRLEELNGIALSAIPLPRGDPQP